MDTSIADAVTGNPVLSTPAAIVNFVRQIRSDTGRTNTSRLFLLSMLFICLSGRSTGVFALNADGFASQNGGTTGGTGGTVVRAKTGTEIHKALCGRGSDDERIIIEVEGTINHGNTSQQKGSCNTADEQIEIKEVSNITIVGVGNGAVFDQIGIHLRKASNIILQNLTIRNVKKSGTPTSNGGDAIGMESDVSNVWVDHCTLEAGGGESEGYDALCDMKAGTKYVTLSYCILRNSGRGGLVGSGDSDNDNGPVTYHHIVYKNIDSRTPLLRFATAHCYNNHYDGIVKSGINARIGGQAKVENNYFENANNPLGTFYTTDMGYWEVKGNIWGENVTWAKNDDETPAGPDPVSTKSMNIPYKYTLDDAGCVPEILEKTAGAGRNLAVSDGTCKSTSVRAGAFNSTGNFSNRSTGYTPQYDVSGRTMRSIQPCRPVVTSRGLVIYGLELRRLYSR